MPVFHPLGKRTAGLSQFLLEAVTVDPVDAVGPYVPILKQGVFHVIDRVTVCRTDSPVAGGEQEHEYEYGNSS